MALLFKWPPYLLCSMAFPVVMAWVPHVQLASLLLLNGSAVHALAVFGNELIANPGILATCSSVETVLTWRMHFVARMPSIAMGYPLPSKPEVGQAASCQYYLLGLWLMCLSAVFWHTLFRHAKSEREEREQYLHSLGFRGRVTWPLFRVMLVQVLSTQLFVTLFIVLFLEELLEGFKS